MSALVIMYAYRLSFCSASAFYSDRKKQRGLFNVFWMTVTVIGYAILLGINPRERPGVAYFALFLCVGGVSPSIPCTIAWLGVNVYVLFACKYTLDLLTRCRHH